MRAKTVTPEATASSLLTLLGDPVRHRSWLILQSPSTGGTIYVGDAAQQPLSLDAGDHITFGAGSLADIYVKGDGAAPLTVVWS